MVKYKLDCMRKKMETQERNATSRASFKCVQCFKTFTDLEVRINCFFFYCFKKLLLKLISCFRHVYYSIKQNILGRYAF